MLLVTQAFSWFQEDVDRYHLGIPVNFVVPQKLQQRYTQEDLLKTMNHSRPYKNLYDAGNPEALCPRPTLPSLRSQVGEYLPQSSSSPSFHPDYHRPHCYQDTRIPPDTGSRRLSTSSSSFSGPNCSRSATMRSPSTDGRRYASSSTMSPHPAAFQSSSVMSSTLSARPTPLHGSTNTLGITATRSTVSIACTNCRSAHLACSDGRPCRRCLQTGRAATCIDVEPKKRGRPRASDQSAISMTTSMMQELTTESSNTSNVEFEDLIIIMSTSLRCARLTSAVAQTLGLPLKTILEQPFSAFIHPSEKQEYARFSLGLLAYPGVTSRPVPVSASRLHQVAISELTGRLSGATVHTHIFLLRSANDGWVPFRFEAYLGSGFGAHPSDPESLRYAYVVLKLCTVERLSHPRRELCSPSSSDSSPHSIADPRREEIGSMYHYGHGSSASGSSTRSTSRVRDSHDYPSHRQPYNSRYEYAENYRPPSRSNFC